MYVTFFLRNSIVQVPYANEALQWQMDRSERYETFAARVATGGIQLANEYNALHYRPT